MVASNMALVLVRAVGCICAGGSSHAFWSIFKTSPFRVRFENKGRFDAYLATIPVYVVLAKYPGIYGVGIALENHLCKENV